MDQTRAEVELARMAQEICANPGTFGIPATMERTGPLGSGCVAVWLGARLRMAGSRVRLAAVRLEGGEVETVLEIWHILSKSWLRIDPLGILPARHERIAEREVVPSDAP